MKNNPMQGIKYALSFVLGAFYASCWWWALLLDFDSEWIACPVLGAALGSVLIVIRSGIFFVEHWRDA